MDNPDYPPPYPSRGGDKEKKLEVVAKDYGRKPYLSKTYSEMMGRIPTRAILDQVLQKKSQFEKPYIDDEEYEEMQHWVPRFSPFDWGDWEDSGPVSGFTPHLSLPPYDPSDTPEGWPGSRKGENPRTECPPIMECNPNNETEVDPGESVNIFVGGMCGDEIKWELLSGVGFSLGSSGDNFSCIFCQPAAFVTLHASSDATGWAYVQATDVQYEAIVVCTVKAKCACPDATFAYTSGNPTSVARGADVTITVDNGCRDFSWSVSGTGFSFAKSTTTERSNILSADNTACGPATIIVTDACGTQVTGVVLCTTGTWVLICDDEVDHQCIGGGSWCADDCSEYVLNTYHWYDKYYTELSMWRYVPGGGEEIMYVCSEGDCPCGKYEFGTPDWQTCGPGQDMWRYREVYEWKCA